MTNNEKKELDSTLKTIERNITKRFKDLENAMFLKLSGVIIASVTIAFFALVWLFDYRQDFINDYNQARFEKLENTVYTPSNEAILNEIRELRDQVSALQNQNQVYAVKKKIKKKHLKR